MKKPHKIALISTLLLILVCSWIVVKDPDGIPESNEFNGINNDSARYTGLLKVDSFRLRVIPPSTGIQFYRDGILFLAYTKDEMKMVPDHVSFGIPDTYYAIVNDSTVESHSVFSSSGSFPYPCENMTFSSDFNTMYFTMVTKKDKREKIFLARYISEGKRQPGWKADESPVNFCLQNAIYTHPTLSSDGQVMIFSSDMPGTLGGMDLFISRKDGDSWSPPINLGSSINTSGNESYPFIDSDNNLYFSSDGLQGNGGYDIYTCKFAGDKWDKPVTLSNLINTKSDDIAFTISKTDGKSAFYSTRQNDPESEIQLFRITIRKDAKDGNLLSVSNVFNGQQVSKSSLATLGIFNRDLSEKNEFAKAAYKFPPAMKGIGLVSLHKMRLNRIKVSVPQAESEVKGPGKISQVKVDTIRLTTPVRADQKDVVIYRVQFLSSDKPQKNNQVLIKGNSYTTYEYFYKGAYRYTIGEFTTVSPAIELQNNCRKQGYPQAFVAAFKNNTRSLDLNLFK